jgi:hypothetical protein
LFLSGYVEPVKDLPGFNLEFNDLLEPTAARYKEMFKLAGFFKKKSAGRICS